MATAIADPKCLFSGEFVRRWTPHCPWAKPIASGDWIVDGLVSWLRAEPSLDQWLWGLSPGQGGQSKTGGLACLDSWREHLATAWSTTATAAAPGVYLLGPRLLSLRTHWLEIAQPLQPPQVSETVLERWRQEVNAAVFLVAVDSGCSRAVVRLPSKLQPTEADVNVVAAALEFVRLELAPILDCLCSQPEIAAAWDRWLR